jgi:hypothetical protein
MIQHVPKSRKEQKSISRHVNLATTLPSATTKYVSWSDKPIEFSKEDDLPKGPRPRHTPMVLKAQIGGYDLRRVTRVNSTNVLDKGLRIGEIGRRMNSKVKSVKQGVYRK